MRPLRKHLAVLALVAAPSILAAQEGNDSARPLSLDEAVRLAQLNSPITVGARNALRTGKLTEMYALGQYLPSIGVSAGGYNSAGASFFQGQFVPYQGNPWNYNKGYSASLLLFDGGQRWFNYRAAQAAQQTNAESETLQRYIVAYTVKQQYYTALQAREMEAAGASALEQAQVALTASSTKVKIGQVTRTDSLKAAIQVGNARLTLLNARAQLRDANAALTRLVASNVPVTAIAADTSDVPRLDVLLAQCAFEGFKRIVGCAETIREGDLHEAGIQVDNPLLQSRNSTSLLRSQGAAMERHVEGDDHVLGATAGFDSMTATQLDGAFHGFRSGGQQKNAVERQGQQRCELLHRLRPNRAGKAVIVQQSGCRLCGDRVDHFAASVAGVGHQHAA